MVVCRLWPGLVSPVGSSSQWPCAVILVSRANLPSQCALSMGEEGGGRRHNANGSSQITGLDVSARDIRIRI